MLVCAVGVNSQTGIIMTLLGAARTVAEEERKAAKREGTVVSGYLEGYCRSAGVLKASLSRD